MLRNYRIIGKEKGSWTLFIKGKYRHGQHEILVQVDVSVPPSPRFSAIFTLICIDPPSNFLS